MFKTPTKLVTARAEGQHRSDHSETDPGTRAIVHRDGVTVAFYLHRLYMPVTRKFEGTVSETAVSFA
jgi:hypothetical protein